MASKLKKKFVTNFYYHHHHQHQLFRCKVCLPDAKENLRMRTKSKDNYLELLNVIDPGLLTLEYSRINKFEIGGA
mgnify:FL=1